MSASSSICQTRSMASYGLMQVLYTTAVDYQDYPFDRTDDESDVYRLPEYLNIADTNFTYAVPYLLSRIKLQLQQGGDGADSPGNWSLGFERTLIVGLNMYNGKSHKTPTSKDPNTRFNWGYGFDVLSRVYMYPPSN